MLILLHTEYDDFRKIVKQKDAKIKLIQECMYTVLSF